ncbi:DDE-type integrase/transposase/recombinase [Cocleimonas sp. KMM 6892]|uniref:Mu transposase C-terminal domain-containing protein n=1 Tax=unclassified Cocleimonas TaxID=2639732 RepID=UPI002DBE2799|nr:MULTISPECIES: DDE-type integrase/transposase/recombinase [unclassified Cocleimonas]MEB8432592.1 DDE-type integrase/transposase/recombinase [Cocleimonas sp. KMM 6892]MEC4715451.1 DDE-type integrase/transposase/recombinase [Cocleimonas sp. KMM 6895]MEC4744930.1 DDE-type integrase/transposase/recombinase [Cocleimonas sp. KMM 6896]
MSSYKNIHIGDRFSKCGVKYEISAINSNQIRYMSVSGGKIHHLPLDKYRTLIEEKSISLIKQCHIKEKLPSNITEEETKELSRKLHYVRTVIQFSNFWASKQHVLPLIIEVSKEIEDKSPPSFSTVARWIKIYVNSDRNPMSLAPNIRNRGNKGKLLDLRIEKIIKKHIQQSYLNKQRLSARAVYVLIHNDVHKMFGIEYIPSERTINRRIDEIDPHKLKKERHGNYEAIKTFKAAGQGTIATRILETIEADGNILDVLIVDDETGEVMGRPYGTCLIDKYSRCIISFVITMIPFSSATLLKALKIAISGNNEKHGGLFETMIVDNGSDYISSSVRNFCNHTGIRIEHGAPRDPNSKPHVERFFGTLNKQLVHSLPGTTFSNPIDKGDYKSEKYACLTLEDLNRFIEQWLETIYHKTIHRGHGRAPEMLWRDSIKDYPITTYPIEDLDTIAREVYQRRINKGRVTVHNLQWFSHALATLEQDYKNKGIPAQVDVYVDSIDLGKVYIRDPRESSVFIQADSVFPDYADGLSLYEHKIIKEKLKEKGKEDQASYGEQYLEVTRWKLYEDIGSHRKEYSRKQIARIKDTNKKLKEAKLLKTKIEQLKTINNLNKISEPDQNSHIQSKLTVNSNKNGSDDTDSFTFERF